MAETSGSLRHATSSSDGLQAPKAIMKTGYAEIS